MFTSNRNPKSTGFYNMHNPKLWNTLDENQKLRDKLKKQISEQYTVKQYGIASLGNYMDEAQKAGEEELKMERNHTFSGESIRNKNEIYYYKNADQLVDRLYILVGSMRAGNNSKELKNEAMQIADRLLSDNHISDVEYNKLYKMFI